MCWSSWSVLFFSWEKLEDRKMSKTGSWRIMTKTANRAKNWLWVGLRLACVITFYLLWQAMLRFLNLKWLDNTTWWELLKGHFTCIRMCLSSCFSQACCGKLADNWRLDCVHQFGVNSCMIASIRRERGHGVLGRIAGRDS